MSKYSSIRRTKATKISAILPTDEQLTGRVGLHLVASYIRNIDLLPIIEQKFGWMRKNRKGLPISELIMQMICFFMDGTSRHLTQFDSLIEDSGYADLISTERLASSHAIKRFFGDIASTMIDDFRELLHKQFLWRLNIVKPEVIVLGIDTMVMNNDDAKKREGVEPTYKHVNGFQPLQMNCGRLMVDAEFRSGEKHSNHGTSVASMITGMVETIRTGYRTDVPIVIRMDAGFFDDKLFTLMEELKVGYECSGKLYENVINSAYMNEKWETFTKDNDREVWEYTEFMSQQDKWKKARRTVYSRLIEDEKQLLLESLGRDSVIITNLGMGESIDTQLRQAGKEQWIEAKCILANYHDRGNDELANRALKTFGHEQLPFKSFDSNMAWYYLMLMSNNLFETFKEDVAKLVMMVTIYADTFRRQFLDTAGKLVRHSGKVVLKVPRASFNRLQMGVLFERCQQGLPKMALE